MPVPLEPDPILDQFLASLDHSTRTLLLNYITHPHLRKILVEKLADLVREGAERLLQAELRRVYGHAYEHPSSSKSSGSSGSNNRSTPYGSRPRAITDDPGHRA